MQVFDVRYNYTMCGGLENGKGRANAKELGLGVIEGKNGEVIIMDKKHTLESFAEVIKKASKGLGPAINETIWQIPRDEAISV